ncbi:MAG: tRNA uridine-5-carboxymethylaminomethyl(34) synthesis GTPase MnmE [Herpetosiphon sp.]
MLYTDTIAAIATPSGEGGVGIVRLSGDEALAIAHKLFRPRRAGARMIPQMLRYGHVLRQDGTAVDEAMAVFFRAPHSYTREDVVEVHCHGGALPLRQTLELALAHGARLAEAGEFTMRAFASGRIDLAQAEATLDLIQARTQTGLELALQQLGGRLSEQIRALRQELIGPLAYLTAMIDFPEDHVPEEAVIRPLQETLVRAGELLRHADQGIIYRYGARAVLVGRPNAGKSSLLNAVLRVERAIVTPIAGTTRDTLEETANLDGVPVVLIDTAGITTSEDPVERLGVERSRRALATADIALLVLDQGEPLTEEDQAIARLTHGTPTVVVINKADLPPLLDPEAVLAEHPGVRGIVYTSAQRGTGLDALGSLVAQMLVGPGVEPGATLITNPRHRDALARAVEGIGSAVRGLEQGQSFDLVAIDLTEAVQALGAITGETVDDDVLTEIFSRFCIGK